MKYFQLVSLISYFKRSKSSRNSLVLLAIFVLLAVNKCKLMTVRENVGFVWIKAKSLTTHLFGQFICKKCDLL